MIPRLNHKGVISKLLEGTKTFDQSLAFNHCGSPSEAFIEVASQRYNDTATPQAAKAVVERDRQERAVFQPAKMLEHEKDKFLEAFPHLQNLGCTLSPEDVEIVESLGPETFAMFKRDTGQIYLAKMTFDWGLETLVAALYEEWLHKDYHYAELPVPAPCGSGHGNGAAGSGKAKGGVLMRIVKNSTKMRHTVVGLVYIAGEVPGAKPSVESREHLVRADSEDEAILRFSAGYAAAGRPIRETVRIKERTI